MKMQIVTGVDGGRRFRFEAGSGDAFGYPSYTLDEIRELLAGFERHALGDRIDRVYRKMRGEAS